MYIVIVLENLKLSAKTFCEYDFDNTCIRTYIHTCISLTPHVLLRLWTT